MSASAEALCEMALGHLGEYATVTLLEGTGRDETAVAKALRRYYTPTLKELLESHPWSFAKRYFTLTGQPGTGTVSVTANVGTFSVDQDPYLQAGDTITIGTVDYVLGARTSATLWALTGANVAASAFTIVKAVIEDPTVDWGYAYRLPAIVLTARRLVDGNRLPIRSNWPVHDLGADASGRLLYCDYSEDVCLEYTELVTTTTRFSGAFDQAFSLLLAARVAPLVTKGDPNKLGLRALQQVPAALARAQATDANESRRDDEPDAELIQGR